MLDIYEMNSWYTGRDKRRDALLCVCTAYVALINRVAKKSLYNTFKVRFFFPIATVLFGKWKQKGVSRIACYWRNFWREDMSKRNLLVVHGSGVIRNRLKSFILSELDDISVFEAGSSKDAILQCQEQRFDILICSKELPDASGLSFYEKVQAVPGQKELSVVFITTTGTRENIKEMENYGVANYMVFPFTSKELRDKINLVCDPRKWRTSERMHIPDVKAIIHSNYDTNYDDIEASVINMSMSGLACDFSCSDEHANILGGTTISIKFPSEHNNFQVKNLPCKFLRLNVLTWKPDGFPDQVRAAWAILGIEGQERKQLEKIFDKAKKGLD